MTICAVSASRCPNPMSDTFESLLVKLSRAGVDYLVAGGVAVCLNGFVRATQDIDLLVEASPANLRRLLACLATFGRVSRVNFRPRISRWKKAPSV